MFFRSFIRGILLLIVLFLVYTLLSILGCRSGGLPRDFDDIFYVVPNPGNSQCPV